MLEFVLISDISYRLIVGTLVVIVAVALVVLMAEINEKLQELLRDKEAGKLITRFEVFQRLGHLVFWGLACAFAALLGFSGVVVGIALSIIFLLRNLSIALETAERKVKPSQHIDPKNIDA